MTVAVKAAHQHRYVKERTKTVLVARYRIEDGRMKYQATSARDLIKQRACSCGRTLAHDLERMVV